MAEQLKQNDINFIDMAGNTYINYFSAFFFIKGEKYKELNLKNRGDNPFTKTGLKLIYALLRTQKLIFTIHFGIAASGIHPNQMYGIIKDFLTSQ